MRATVKAGGTWVEELRVPGDKSIAHRWLILASIASGRSRLVEVPGSLDVRSTASCMARLAPGTAETLDLWASRGADGVEGGGSTWNAARVGADESAVEVEGQGLQGLAPPDAALDCGNSGTSMRLLTGLLAGRPWRTVLTGDDSLRTRPMERVAAPLREMGAAVMTDGGHAPIEVEGGRLTPIRYAPPVPSAQVKSAVLLAGLQAEGETEVRETVATRDHTERALEALGARCHRRDGVITVAPGAFEGFEVTVPGDPSSAMFAIGAAALLGHALTIEGVGLNPTRLHALEVLARMGVEVDVETEREELGEPVGRLRVRPTTSLHGTRIAAAEIPLVIDEVPVLAAIAAHAPGETWFEGAGELRVKESDRLSALASGLVALGGHAGEEGDDLVVAGTGLRGGAAAAHGDHRMAMSFAVAALAADGPCAVDGVESADVSFPGFLGALTALGAVVEVG